MIIYMFGSCDKFDDLDDYYKSAALHDGILCR